MVAINAGDYFSRVRAIKTLVKLNLQVLVLLVKRSFTRNYDTTKKTNSM